MTRWLDALGPLKWPSLALIAAPIAAYPSWQPPAPAAAECGPVTVDGQPFRAFKAADGSTFILRPAREKAPGAPVLDDVEPAGFEAGALLVDAADKRLAALTCAPARGN